MKRILIVLLSIVFVISLVSCEKDKSEEMITAYTEFIDGYSFCKNALNIVWKYFNLSDGEIELDGKGTGSVDYTALGNLLTDILGIKVTDTLKCEAVSGRIIGERTDKDSLMKRTYDGVVIEASNDDYSGDGVKDITLKIDGTFLRHEGDSSEDKLVYIYEYDFTVNGVAYEIEYGKYNPGDYIYAVVNGTGVDVRLLNSQLNKSL